MLLGTHDHRHLVGSEQHQHRALMHRSGVQMSFQSPAEQLIEFGECLLTCLGPYSGLRVPLPTIWHLRKPQTHTSWPSQSILPGSRSRTIRMWVKCSSQLTNIIRSSKYVAAKSRPWMTWSISLWKVASTPFSPNRAEPVMTCSITEVLPGLSWKTAENTSSTLCNMAHWSWLNLPASQTSVRLVPLLSPPTGRSSSLVSSTSHTSIQCQLVPALATSAVFTCKRRNFFLWSWMWTT